MTEERRRALLEKLIGYMIHKAGCASVQRELKHHTEERDGELEHWATVENPNLPCDCGLQGILAEAEAARAVDPTPEPPPVPDYVTALTEAQTIIRASMLWQQFIEHTPLEHDIAVWMVDFAFDVVRRASALMREAAQSKGPSAARAVDPQQEQGADDEQITTNLRYARGLIRKAQRSGASFVDVNVAVLSYLVENRRNLNDRLRWAQQRAEAAERAALVPPQEMSLEYINAWRERTGLKVIGPADDLLTEDEVKFVIRSLPENLSTEFTARIAQQLRAASPALPTRKESDAETDTLSEVQRPPLPDESAMHEREVPGRPVEIAALPTLLEKLTRYHLIQFTMEPLEDGDYVTRR